jgi:hypothetical protein
MKEKNVGWVEQRETQPTPKFIKALKIKGSEFLFNESSY